MSPWLVVGVVAIALVASFGQTVAGFGFALLAVPPLGVIVDPKDAVAASMVLLPTSCALMVWSDRAHIEWEATKTLLIGAVPGLPIGLAIIAAMSGDALKVALAFAAIASVVLIGSGFVLERRSRRVELLAGFLCGLLTTSINTNGPPVAVALQAQQMPRDSFRPTTSAVLAIASVAGAIIFAATGRMTRDVGLVIAVAVPSLLVGWRLGLAARAVVPEPKFRPLILGLLVAGAVVTVASVVA